MGMSVTDTVMVSAIFGTDPLAAVAVGSDLYSIVFYLSAGVLGGIAPFYTAAVPRSDPHARARPARIRRMTAGLPAALTVPVVCPAPLWLRERCRAPGSPHAGVGPTPPMAHTPAPT